MFRKKCLLIIGGSGQLGNECINKFKSGYFSKWKVFNIDKTPNPKACQNYIIDPSQVITPNMIENIH